MKINFLLTLSALFLFGLGLSSCDSTEAVTMNRFNTADHEYQIVKAARYLKSDTLFNEAVNPRKAIGQEHQLILTSPRITIDTLNNLYLWPENIMSAIVSINVLSEGLNDICEGTYTLLEESDEVNPLYNGDETKIYAPVYDIPSIVSAQIAGGYTQQVLMSSGQMTVKKGPMSYEIVFEFKGEDGVTYKGHYRGIILQETSEYDEDMGWIGAPSIPQPLAEECPCVS